MTSHDHVAAKPKSRMSARQRTASGGLRSASREREFFMPNTWKEALSAYRLEFRVPRKPSDFAVAYKLLDVKVGVFVSLHDTEGLDDLQRVVEDAKKQTETDFPGHLHNRLCR